MSKKFVTKMIFKTSDPENKIDTAMLARFPEGEWREVRERSSFESLPLLRPIVEHYFDNAQEILSSLAMHLFDTIYDNEVILIFTSAAQPILCSQFNDKSNICRSVEIEYCSSYVNFSSERSDKSSETNNSIVINLNTPSSNADDKLPSLIAQYEAAASAANSQALLRYAIENYCINAAQIANSTQSPKFFIRHFDNSLIDICICFNSSTQPLFICK